MEGLCGTFWILPLTQPSIAQLVERRTVEAKQLQISLGHWFESGSREKPFCQKMFFILFNYQALIISYSLIVLKKLVERKCQLVICYNCREGMFCDLTFRLPNQDIFH